MPSAEVLLLIVVVEQTLNNRITNNIMAMSLLIRL